MCYIFLKLYFSRALEFEAFVSIDESQLNEESLTYKYFIAQKTTDKKRLFLKHVEHVLRKLTLNSNLVVCSDKWPFVNEENKLVRVDSGWLQSGENEIQFHFFDAPLQLWNAESDEKRNSYGVVIRPLRKTSNGLVELTDYAINRSVSFLNIYSDRK